MLPRSSTVVLFLGLLLMSCGGGGGSGASGDNGGLAAPSNVVVIAGNRQVAITWSSVPGATSHNLYWDTTAGVSKTNGTRIAAVESPHVHASLTNGITYYYVVTALNDGGESSESAAASATPSSTAGATPGAPTGVSAIAGNQDVTIHWDTVSGATGYSIYWSLSPGVAKATGTRVSAASSPYLHEGLTNDAAYYYVVTAENTAGESAESTEVSAIPAPQSWITVSAGQGHSLGVQSNGSLWAWGNNDLGQLGDGTRTARHTPVRIGLRNDWTTVAAGAKHALAITEDGTAWAWGDNSEGKIGQGTSGCVLATGSGCYFSPTPVLEDVAAVAANQFSSFARKSNGTLWTWGRYWTSTPGGTSSHAQRIPIQVAGQWSGIFSGAAAAHLLSIPGASTRLYAWGSNLQDQLGVGRFHGGQSIDDHNDLPMRVCDETTQFDCNGIFTGLAQIFFSGASVATAGASSSLAIKTDGTLWGWGADDSGQLGDGSPQSGNVKYPAQVGSGTDWKTVVTGEDRSFGIRTDGSLWAWGNNFQGGLGLGDTVDRNVPNRVGTDSWIAVSTGGDTQTCNQFLVCTNSTSHTLAIKTDGTLWAWGGNSFGQLGDGTTAGRIVPVQVP